LKVQSKLHNEKEG